MIDLKDKTVLVTGGSRGIGAACVELFSRAGARVAFTYKSDVSAATKLENKMGGQSAVRGYQVDMASETEIASCVENVLKDFGRIDILVNNAGIWKYGEVDKMTLQEWEETIRVNLTGLFLMTRAVVPGMKQNGFGRIINIASTAGQRGEAFHSHYAASKGGVISFTKSLAGELGGFNINTNCVAPGWVDTEMVADVFSDRDYKESVRKAMPVGRIATAMDIAGPVLFLASPLADNIIGEILNVNGGSVLCG